ncbi:MAG: hydrogenase nickel incorporation protein HypB [Promethearchaeota archaeon]
MGEEEFPDDIGPIIEMNEDILRDNRELAGRNNRIFKKYGIHSIDIVGAIGSGKTAIIERLAERFRNEMKIHVICGDVATSIDSDRIEQHGAVTYQINTGKECALNAYHIKEVLKNRIVSLTDIDLLIIENVGNLICPSDFILGTDRRIMVVSVTEGDHVIIKHPLLVKMSEILIINKIDLVEILGTDLDRMIKDALMINPKIQVLPVSAKTGKNIDKLINLIKKI